MYKIFIISLLLIFFGCAHNTPNVPIDGYNALGTISDGGFARDKSQIKKLDGKRVRIWGYLDYSNTSTCAMNKWHFALKASKNAETGESIHINTPAKYSFAQIYNKIRQMQKTEQQTPVLVTGILHTFKAPTSLVILTGIEIDVSSPDDIKFK